MMRVVVIAISLVLVSAPGAQALFALMPADRVNEVPIARLLANLERNAQGLTPAQQARAIGRLHLLAYLRQSEKLTVYRDRPDDIAEGRIDDCITLDEQSMGKGTRANWPKAKPGELCEARRYRLGPEHEIPYVSELPPANAHLAAAIAAYDRARALEPDNLRTRLALAFALDRGGQREQACSELRFVAQRGLQLVKLPRIPGEPKTDWETHVVLGEAAEHFARIAISENDKRLVAALKERLDRAPPQVYITPILVPLEADASPSSMMDRTSKVAFDFTGQGEKMRLGWLNANAAWLVWDAHGLGRVESGFQMFGSVTWISFWENGYLPLGALDDDGDGKIAGDELNGLALWRDANKNGNSEEGEVKPVASYEIVALGFDHKRAGDHYWKAERGAVFASGEVRATYDWRLGDARITSVVD
jgi:hypothetical protein